MTSDFEFALDFKSIDRISTLSKIRIVWKQSLNYLANSEMFARDIWVSALTLMFILPDLKMIWKLNFDRMFR